MGTRKGSRPASAERRLKELGIKLPAPPEPFGTYMEAVQAGNLLSLTGMLPTEGHEAKFVGRVGAELDVETGRKAAHLAALNVLAVARQHLGMMASPRATCLSRCRRFCSSDSSPNRWFYRLAMPEAAVSAERKPRSGLLGRRFLKRHGKSVAGLRRIDRGADGSLLPRSSGG
jgi:enamine deaminase RidA (YjgF/YER057c/UK114 family)